MIGTCGSVSFEPWLTVSPISVVTGHAIERRLPARRRRVLFTMTVDAPAHRERRRRRLQPDEIQEIVRQARPVLRRVGGHVLDRPVTRLALEACANVSLVREVGELGKL